MYKYLSVFFLSLFIFTTARSQQIRNKEAKHWADSVFYSLTDDQRIAQLMVLRESSYNKEGPVYYDSGITQAIQKYDIGGIVLFQGSPVVQAEHINYFQGIARTPLMVCIDGEWGLGMRLDSVVPLNYQMMLGAVNDTSIIAAYGDFVGRQCRREGIEVNFAPVVDINNNPDNPVINFRSFGENKYRVAQYGVTYMRALQHEGILACAKHFPGHGDVSVDSHLDLPVIHKTLQQLDTLELYPFKQMFAAGVGSVMNAHLYIPAIDSTPNTATSLSRNSVTGLLRNKLHFNGLAFTDALGMKGVAKYFPGGDIAAQSLIAGNDVLCLPEDVATSIASIRQAILDDRLTWSDIYAKCRKVLEYKYRYGVAHAQPVDTTNLADDLNRGAFRLKTLVADNALTVLSDRDSAFFPLSVFDRDKQIAYVAIGTDTDHVFSRRMQADFDANVFYFDYRDSASRATALASMIDGRYKYVVIGVHHYRNYPAGNFGISGASLQLLHQLLQDHPAIVFDFGNPYAIRNFCDARNLVACYEDDSTTQEAAADLLEGRIVSQGTLPVTVCPGYPSGDGVVTGDHQLAVGAPEKVHMNAAKLAIIDSIARDGIAAGAYPGCVVLAARDGQIVFERAYGKYNYDTPEPMNTTSIFDMASVTKVCATTLAVMKLYDEGRLSLNKTLGYYLPWVRKSNKAHLKIRDILLHQAGLVAYIPFYKAVIDTALHRPSMVFFSRKPDKAFSVRVAQNLYMRNDYVDSMYKLILQSRLGPRGRYVYSDNDFIFMGKIVEHLSGLTLDKYVDKYFYKPMGLGSTGFLPRQRFDTNRVVPTEDDETFRMQHLHADVHDPGSAMFGEVAGHAGLFSDADNLAAIMQMLLNGGTFKGRRYIKPGTVRLFTAYNSSTSRRGFGFDKPEKDNAQRREPYPSRYASPLTFGHTGYTGTCVWADPKYHLVYIFLSNRVNPSGGDNMKLIHMNVRGKIQDAIYDALEQR